MSRKFILIIGPSGVGKGTMLKMLREKHPEIFFPVSATTREPRPSEKEGETYYFLSNDEFLRKIDAGEFLEYALVHGGNSYGTPKAPIFQALKEGKTVVREVDYQGFLSIKKIIPDQITSIFILPPPLDILKKRILERAPISEAELDARMESLKKEVAIAKECDIQLETIDGDIEGSYKRFEKAVINNY